MKKLLLVLPMIIFVSSLGTMNVYAYEVEVYNEVQSISLVELSEQGEENNFVPISPFIQILSARSISPNCHTHPNLCPGPFPISQASEVTSNYRLRHRTYAFFRTAGWGPIVEASRRHRDSPLQGGRNTAISGWMSQHALVDAAGAARLL